MAQKPAWTRAAVVVAVGSLLCVWLVISRSPSRVPEKPSVVAVPMESPGQHGVDDRVREYGETVRGRLEPDFQRAGVPYPPAALTLIGLKQEKTLAIYAPGRDGRPRFIRSYPILAASGQAGPKLREGDFQVPEGLYRIESLNPNSFYHLALRVNYPNEFDRGKAADENRTEPGSDIMIHGKALSAGCLAMGDPAAEDLFVLAALTGINNIQLILSPVDFRVRERSPAPEDPGWLPGVYGQIRNELRKYPATDQPASQTPANQE